MNFKKFISGVSAFAIAASAFAGMAVTANAATYSVDKVLFGTVNDGVVSAQTDFTGDNAVTLEAAKTYAGTTFMEGSALNFANKEMEADFDEVVTAGKVHFSASYTVVGGNTNLVKVVDSTGKTVIGLYPTDSRNSGNINTLTIDNTATANGYVYTPRNVAYRAEVTIDLDAKTYDYTVTACSGGSSGTVNKISPYTGKGNLTNISDVKGITCAKNGYYLDNVYLYTEKSTETLYNYTVNYVYNEENIKVDTASVPADTVITAETVFTKDGQKYYIVDATAPTLTVSADGENVLNVPVRLAENYAVSVKAVGDVEQDLVTDTAVEGENYTYTIPQYIVENGVAYEATKLTDSSYYRETVNSISENYTKEVTYTKQYENVVIAEDLDGSDDKMASVRASKGSAYNNAAYTSAELSAGKYVAVVNFTNIGRGSTLTVGETELINASSFTKNAWSVATTAEFTVEDGAKIVWNAGGSNTYDPIDTVIIYKVEKGEPAPQYYNKGYTFTTSNDIASKKYTKLTIKVNDTADNNKPGYATVDIADQIATITGPAALTIFIKNIPAAYEVTSVELN